MNKSLLNALQVILVCLDLAVLNLLAFICSKFYYQEFTIELLEANFEFLILINISWIIVSWFGRLYEESQVLSFESFTRKSIKLYLVWIGFVLIYFFLNKGFLLSRLFIVSTLAAFLFGLLVIRLLYLGIMDFFKKRNRSRKRVLIIGYNEVARRLTRYLEDDELSTEVLGYTENFENVKELTRYPVLSEINDTIKVSKEMEVNEILSTIAPEQNHHVYDLMLQAEKECMHFRFIPDFSLYITRPVHIEYLKDIPILSLRSEPLEDINNRFKKRLLDIVVSFFVGIFILSWLIPIIGMLIYLESPGPIFFKQVRSGKNNKPFVCLKFRSMFLANRYNEKQVTRDDNRVTKMGKFLRKTSLDEFPQFINVLKGEMSLVGPRPHMLEHTESFSKMVSEYMVRQFLKPGLTGWAQVNGFRGGITDPIQIINRVEYDISYLENWSFWLDIKILFQTIYILLLKKDKNAY